MSWSENSSATNIDNLEPARWLADRFAPVAPGTGMGIKVGSFLPRGFQTYARVFHPASRHNPVTRTRQQVTWAEVAAQTGRIAHPQMQFHRLMGCPDSAWWRSPPGWISRPSIGHLDKDALDRLTGVLGEFTLTPGLCYFCLWEGYGAIRKYVLRKRQAVEIGEYRYLLFQGPLRVIPQEQSPNLWWPEDRAWCVSTDIDSLSTLVGGSREMVARLVRHSGLEALLIGVDDRVDIGSDMVNA